ncbi:AlpA family transcriptional regulator [Burkholderia sp. Se-20378]|uniref:helix-turn-helix transcriptional regulator n=1 Tax=Burkholderia sp. Se-20378 TaxID=2703899 RepID=UPI00197F0A3F|nr:AlpA family phage regulatory protein [Burkholderia sp. Se-20378]MBN3770716.1 AlpA family phage regulatory protein [Burkholderia sp. Se-20378]
MSDSRYPLLLDQRGVSKAVGLCLNTIKRIPDFPKPIKLDGVRAVRWRSADVCAWAARQTVRGDGVTA